MAAGQPSELVRLERIKALMRDLRQPHQQQQGGAGDALDAWGQYRKYAGGGAAAAGGGEAGAITLGSEAPGLGILGSEVAGPAAGGEIAAGAGGAEAGLASNPIGWIAAMLLAQNVMHNKDISSWNDALKGQAGAEAGDYFLGEDPPEGLKNVLGVAGLSSGGGALNPAYLPKKLFGFF